MRKTQKKRKEKKAEIKNKTGLKKWETQIKKGNAIKFELLAHPK